MICAGIIWYSKLLGFQTSRACYSGLSLLLFLSILLDSYSFFDMLQAVQKLIDEEFQGIAHLRTSTLHKKIATARHDFIKISGAENKLESLLQVDYKLVIVLGFFYTNECELCVCWSK